VENRRCSSFERPPRELPNQGGTHAPARNLQPPEVPGCKKPKKARLARVGGPIATLEEGKKKKERLAQADDVLLALKGGWGGEKCKKRKNVPVSKRETTETQRVLGLAKRKKKKRPRGKGEKHPPP